MSDSTVRTLAWVGVGWVTASALTAWAGARAFGDRDE